MGEKLKIKHDKERQAKEKADALKAKEVERKRNEKAAAERNRNEKAAAARKRNEQVAAERKRNEKAAAARKRNEKAAAERKAEAARKAAIAEWDREKARFRREKLMRHQKRQRDNIIPHVDRTVPGQITVTYDPDTHRCFERNGKVHLG